VRASSPEPAHQREQNEKYTQGFVHGREPHHGFLRSLKDRKEKTADPAKIRVTGDLTNKQRQEECSSERGGEC
jgi:hypothetical protein